jgi:hypothetical protein
VNVDPLIDSLVEFAQRTGIYGFMTSTWGWPAVESLHFIALAVMIGTVGLFDLRVLGMAKDIPLAALHQLIPLGIVAFVLSVLTGALFLLTEPRQYVYNPAFQLKLLCMGVAGANAAVFYVSRAKRVLLLPPQAPAPLAAKLAASISLTAWLGVIVCGRVITAFRPPYHWCPWC